MALRSTSPTMAILLLLATMIRASLAQSCTNFDDCNSACLTFEKANQFCNTNYQPWDSTISCKCEWPYHALSSGSSPNAPLTTSTVSVTSGTDGAASVAGTTEDSGATTTATTPSAASTAVDTTSAASVITTTTTTTPTSATPVPNSARKADTSFMPASSALYLITFLTFVIALLM